MAGPYSRREHKAARIIQRFLHHHVAIWLDWDDHDLLDILEEWTCDSARLTRAARVNLN